MWSMLWTLLKVLFRNRNAMEDLRQASRQHAAIQAVLGAFQSGDYAAALAASEELKENGRETACYCFYQGGLRRNLGDPAAAEQWLRKAQPLETDPRLAVLTTEALAEVLLEQGRYDEARTTFEASLRQGPERSSSDRGIAETWLRQGERLDLALNRAKAAVAKQQAREDDPAGKYNLAENLALLAWAIAAAEPDSFRVQSLAREASALISPRESVPTAAQVQFHLGCAYAALSDDAHSRNHFAEAARIDPHGHWGAAARRCSEVPVAE